MLLGSVYYTHPIFTTACYYGAVNVDKPKDGIWIIDAGAVTVYASVHMAEIVGDTQAEMLGQPSFSYLYHEDVAAAQRLFDFKKRGDAGPFHFRLRRKDGSAIWADVQGTPMRNAAGEFTGIVGTFTVSS
ncbi:MAG: PAS domain-containing protein [Acidobacteriota bacterium]